jgi:hypothetical protein
MKVKIVATGTEVELVHHGFDIVIVQYDNGLQKCLTCAEVGLKKRIRPTSKRY